MGGITLTDNSDAVLAELKHKCNLALEQIGLAAIGNAGDLINNDTGRLAASIEHTVTDDSVVWGTNCEYAPYVEFGTGIYSTIGGRQTPWVYQDDRGRWHWTRGSRAQEFIKGSIVYHEDEYYEILENVVKG